MKNKGKRKTGRPVGWDDELWERRFAELCDFREKFGHVRVPAYWRGNRSLGRWLAYQRQQGREGKIQEDRGKRLAAMGVEFERITEPFVEGLDLGLERMLARLSSYRERYGHVGVTPKRDRLLHKWIACQRSYRKTGTLKKYRRELMDAAGFPWKPVDYRWEEQFVMLCAFKKKHGHSSVPCRWMEDKVLGRWVAHQRENHRAGKLLAEHRRKLDAIGFDWVIDSRPKRWSHSKTVDDQMIQLRVYKARFGNTRVPKEWSEDRSLARWVKEQRRLFREGRMPEERKRKLDALGFEWEVKKRG